METRHTEHQTRKAFAKAMADPASVMVGKNGIANCCIIGEVERCGGEILVYGPRMLFKWSARVTLKDGVIAVHDTRSQRAAPLCSAQVP
jgi:hypothetical protein